MNETDNQNKGLLIGIVAAEFNREYVDGLLDGALKTLSELGVDSADIEILRVPGVYEIPLAVRALASRCDAVIVAGCVIRGETAHFEYVVDSCRDGVLQVMLETNTPVTTAILTVDNHKQAQERSGKDTNRGSDAAAAAMKMIGLLWDNKL